MISDNPFDKPSGTLSAEDQAEYDRLEALERDSSGVPEAEWERLEREDPTGASGMGEMTNAEYAAFVREDHTTSGDADANYPVRNAAVNWADASNGGDTSQEVKATYDTPWGRRALSALEVRDLEQQGHTLTPVDADPETSLQDERDEMSKVDLSFRQD